MDEGLERAVIGKVFRHIIPLVILLYFVNFLDRVNVGFAALTMNQDLGFSPEVFGFGGGIFFLGYFLFEVPSNVVLERVGARLWIARIMITWGIISTGMALVSGEISFYVMRFLLGVAEAGFFPGIVLYLTYWVPSVHRARLIAAFLVAVPVSGVLGSPLSGAILRLGDFGGLASWQWLFIVEGVPAFLLGFCVLVWMIDRPEKAKWLTADEKAWLGRVLDAEREHREKARHFSLGEALANPRVLALGLVYFGIVTGLYGIGLWMPQIVKNFGLSNLAVGFVVAIPYLIAAICMVIWSRHSDLTTERTWHVALAAVVGCGGLAASAYFGSPILAMVALTFAAIGIYAAIPPFWAMPTAFLSGTAAAGGIALINSMGNLGGFFGPSIVGWVKQSTGSFTNGLLALAAFVLMAGVLALLIGHDRGLERAPAAEHGRP